MDRKALSPNHWSRDRDLRAGLSTSQFQAVAGSKLVALALGFGSLESPWTVSVIAPDQILRAVIEARQQVAMSIDHRGHPAKRYFLEALRTPAKYGTGMLCRLPKSGKSLLAARPC